MGTRTPNLNLYKPAPGDGQDNAQEWFDQVNANFDTLDAHVLTSGERQVAAMTPVLGINETALIEVDLSLACDLTVLTTDHPAWVRVYGSAAARTEDAIRPSTVNVVDGRGCYAECITYLPDGLELNWSEVPTFHNLDAPRTGKAYLAVTNLDPGYSGPISLRITFLPIESLNPGAAQGPAGLDGRTILALTRDPLPTDGVDGDGALNTATTTLFFPKAAGAWPAGVPLVGPLGTPGVDGNTVLYGPGNPTAADGVDGNFYLNTATLYFFGPKAADAWPAGVSLVGTGGGGGVVLATAEVVESNVLTGTGLIPLDDTIPQSSEGSPFLSITYTPVSNTSFLTIEAFLQLSPSNLRFMLGAIFKDADVNAIASAWTIATTGGYPAQMSIRAKINPLNNSPMTFSVRAGADSSATLTLNGSGGTRRLGGTLRSYIRVTETTK